MSDDCSRYLIDDPDEDAPTHARLCRCPICKGFLPQYFPMDKPFRCKKCGTELMIFPDVDEDDGHLSDYEGRICPISKPKVELI